MRKSIFFIYFLIMLILFPMIVYADENDYNINRDNYEDNAVYKNIDGGNDESFIKESNSIENESLFVNSNNNLPISFSESVISGWKIINGDKYYYENGKPLEGFNTVEGKRYYFEEGRKDLIQ